MIPKPLKSGIWLFVLTLLAPAVTHAADISGVPKIRDGDQITIGNTRIRLGGIDAPSADQMPSIGCNIKWKAGQEPQYYDPVGVK